MAPRRRRMLLFRRAGRPFETASFVQFVVLERVPVQFEALSGVVPIVFGLGSSAADMLVSAA